MKRRIHCLVGAITLSFVVILANTSLAASKTKFDSGAWSQQTAGKTVDVLVYKSAEHVVLTPGSIAGGGLIDSFTRPDGSRIPLPDSAYVLADKLISQLGTSTGVSFKKKEDLLSLPVPKEKDVGSYQQQSSADYVLEVTVPSQIIGYEPLAWATYYFQLIVESRLIDNKSGQVLWKYHNRCHPKAKDGSLTLRRDEFSAQEGKRLKEILDKTTDLCAAELLKEFRGEK